MKPKKYKSDFHANAHESIYTEIEAIHNRIFHLRIAKELKNVLSHNEPLSDAKYFLVYYEALLCLFNDDSNPNTYDKDLL